MKLKGITQTFKFVVLTLLVGFFTQTGWSTHIVGAEMSYECLGNGTYEVTLIVRRDCDNGDPEASFDDPAVIGIYDRLGSLLVSLGYWGKLQIPFSGSTIIESDLEFCQVDGTVACVEEATYIGTVNLPYSQLGYILSYERCCRNISLDNVLDPTGTGGTYFIELNSASQHDCNSSPVFGEWPDIYTCVNDKWTFDHSAADPESDSLSYYFITPYNGASIDNPQPDPPNNPPYSNIEWNNGFSAENPWIGDMTIDANTGEICGTPTALGQFLIGVAVDEFRDGEFLGTVYRDFEINVVLCTGNVSADFEIGGPGAECDGLTFEFENTSTGNGDLEYTWFFDWPNTTPSSNEDNPTFTYDEEGTYTVLLEASSGECTVTTEQTVSAFEEGVTGEIVYTVISCDGDNVTIEVSHTFVDNDGTPIEDVEWSITVDGETITTTSPSVIIVTTTGGVINATATAIGGSSGCVSTFGGTDVNVSDLFPNADYKATVFECGANGTVIQFEDATDHGNFIIEGYNWSINYTNESGDNVSESYNDSSFTITSSGDQIILDYGVSYTNGCQSEELLNETLDVMEDIFPDLDITISGESVGENGGCIGATGQILEVLNTNDCIAGDVSSVIWTVVNPEGQTTTYDGNGVDVGDSIVDGTTVTVTVTYSNGCVVTATELFNVEINADTTNFNCQITECTQDGYVLVLSPPSTNFAIESIVWTVTVNGSTDTFTDQTIIVNVPFGGSAEASVDIVYTNGCTFNSNTSTFDDTSIQPDFGFSGSGIVGSGDGGNGNGNGNGNNGNNGNGGDDCPTLGNSLQLDVNSSKIAGEITSIEWTIAIGSNVFNYTGNPIDISGVSGQGTVSVSVTYSNGCTFTYSENNVELDGTNGSSTGIDFTLVSCGADGSFTVNLGVQDFPGFAVQSVEWTFNINTVASSSTELNPTIVIPGGGFAVAGAQVVFTNGCTLTIGPITLNEDSLSPDFDIVQNSNGGTQVCPFDGGTLGVNILSSNVSGDIIGYSWTVTVAGNTTFFSGNPIDISGLNGDATVTVVVSYSNGCSFTYTENIILDGGPGNGGDATFTYSVVECGADGSSVVVFTLPTYAGFAVQSANWTFNLNGTVSTSTDFNPSITIPDGGFVEASVQVTLTSGCVINLGPSTITSDSLVPNFDIVAGTGGGNLDCPFEGGTLSLNVLSSFIAGDITDYNWTVTVGGNTFNFSGNPIDITGLNGDATVSVAITYSNGCSFTYTENIVLNGGSGNDGNTSFTYSVVECGSDGSSVVVFTLPTYAGFAIQSATWTFDLNGTVSTSTELNPSITISNGGFVVASVQVVLTTGCIINLGPTTITSDSLIPNFDIVISTGGDGGTNPGGGSGSDPCNPGSQSVSIVEVGGNFIAGDITGVSWTVTVGGQTFTFSGNPADLGSLTGEAGITAVVSYSNGCIFTYSETIVLTGGSAGPVVPSILFSPAGCSSDGAVQLVLSNGNFPTNFSIQGVSWTIDINGTVTTSSEFNPTIVIPVGGNATVSSIVTFSNGCVVSANTILINYSDVVPTLDISLGLAPGADCSQNPTDYQINVNNSLNAASDCSIIYSINGGESVSGTDGQLVNLSTGDEVVVTATCVFFGSCTVVSEQVFMANGGGDPAFNPEFNGNPVVDCDGDDTQLILNGNPNFTYTYVPTTGLDFTNGMHNPIVTVTEPTTYTVTISDGVCSVTETILVILQDDATPDIGITGDGTDLGEFCEMISLEVTNPIEGVEYVWTIEGEVVGMGISFEYDEPFQGEVCVQIAGTENAQCNAQSCIEVTNGSLFIEFESPFTLCEGDTIGYALVNFAGYQQVEFEFEDSPFILGVSNTGVPTIVGGEDYAIIFTATNQFGCSTTDTVTILAGVNEQLEIDATLDDCGTTATFNATGIGSDSSLVWDFGDEDSPFNESSDINPDHYYGDNGTYTVTVMDNSSICAGLPGELELEIDGLDVELDTIIYDGNEATVSATLINGPADITWCDTDGNEIGSGPEITITVEDQKETLLAKALDAMGCADTISISIPMNMDTMPDGPPDVCCIEGPDWGPNGADGLGPCPGDTFQLRVLVNDTLRNFTYDWGPDECIVDGDDEQEVFVTIQETSKTYSVTVTDPDNMLDTVLTFTAAPVDVIATLVCTPENALRGQEVVITVESNFNIVGYDWFDGTTEPSTSLILTEEAEVSVSLIDVNGCLGDASKVIEEPPADPCNIENFDIPNAFSPNGDTQNDEFRVITTVVDFTSFEFFVYDRWGEEIFITDDPNIGWDGLYEGKELTPDVYAYCLKVTCPEGGEMITAGNVSLMK